MCRLLETISRRQTLEIFRQKMAFPDSEIP